MLTRPAFSVHIDAVGTDEVRDPGFYFAKIPTGRVDQVAELEQLGFSVVDVNQTFEHTGTPLTESTTEVQIRPHEPGDRDSVLHMAETSFTFSRFHLDPRIENQVANRIKREWVGNYLCGVRGDRLTVALLDGQPAGFLAELSTEHEGQRVRVIDLIAVAPGFQRRGVGRALTTNFVTSYPNQGDRLRVGTQVANTPSLRLYTSLGFQPIQSTYVLHAHIT